MNEVNSYFAVYKCPLCNTLIRHGESHEATLPQLVEVMGKLVSHQQFVGTIFYNSPMNVPHQCDNGNFGFAAFAGFYKDRS